MSARCAWVSLLLACSTAAAAQSGPRVHLLRVTDGDTLWVQRAGERRPTKVRIQGIDAPESCQPGGDAARQALSRLLSNQTLRLSAEGHDRHGRVLAVVWAGNQDVGAALVRQGQAWSYRFHDDPGPYVEEESRARRERIGLHATPGAEHPRDFRRRHGPCEEPAAGTIRP